MTTLFISDLHLSPARPGLTQLFFDFLKESEANADALYILGDLFDYWIGDDDHHPLHTEVCARLRQLSESGTAVFLMVGNRDLLIGKNFAEASGCQRLADPTCIELGGQRTVLTHGDQLCTDDWLYQVYRKVVHQGWLQRFFLTWPLSWRRQFIKKLQQQSYRHQLGAPIDRLDVQTPALKKMLKDFQATQLIHGHTHQPGVHYLQNENTWFRRITLSDWHPDQGQVLIYENETFRLEELRHEVKE